MASAGSGADLLERDARCVWHPYAPPMASPLFEVRRAEGVRLELADGRLLIDGMSSWWAAIHGYRHPHIEQAVRAQLERMPHVMFGGLTHEPAVRLCERLVEMTPAGLERVFLSDSGSVAVEVALKLAFQYWIARGEPRRCRMLTVRGGYHGDTFGAMAVCDPVTGMHELFRHVLPQHLFAERPGCRFDEPCLDHHVAGVAALLDVHGEEIAAVVLEPIVQGAGGMWFYAPDYLRRLRELCDAHGVLLIFDEIATGFGRTGRLFAAEHAGVSPDLMCLGKALTGGTLTLAATITTREIEETIATSPPGALMHGPTFMANPLACAAAGASLDLLDRERWRPRVEEISAQLAVELEPCRRLPGVTDVRVLGAIGVVELESPVDMRVVQPAFVAEGIWIRPFGRLVYTMPPYTIAPAELSLVTRAIERVLTRWTHHRSA